MNYLVDANILSEATKPLPHPRVVEWLRAHQSDLAVDPVILGEIRFGIYVLPAGSRRRRLEKWFVQVIETLHCVDWDAATGLRWAQLLAALRAGHVAMPIKDSFIAATALQYNLTLATHNTAHFVHCGVKLIDPFVD
jgi:toxin FitB